MQLDFEVVKYEAVTRSFTLDRALAIQDVNLRKPPTAPPRHLDSFRHRFPLAPMLAPTLGKSCKSLSISDNSASWEDSRSEGRKMQKTPCFPGVFQAEGTGFEPPAFLNSRHYNDFGGKCNHVKVLAASGASRSFPVSSGLGGMRQGQNRDNNSGYTFGFGLWLICCLLTFAALVQNASSDDDGPRREGSRILNVPLIPKVAGGPLRVIIIGRISTIHQPESNIQASYRYAEDYLSRVYQGPLEIRHLGERASGMVAERETILTAMELIVTGEWDLVLAEDLSRIFRNPRFQYVFVQDAVDAGTRVICIADQLDTADDNWETMMGVATLRHGLVIPDTRRRVKRTATDSFYEGGMVLKVRFGYRKLTKEDAQSGQYGPRGLRLMKLSEWTETICEMARRAIRGDTYNSIADWLNENGIRPGKYAGELWTGRLVADFLSNELLGGYRTFRKFICKSLYRTGKPKRTRNTTKVEVAYHPDLAHLPPDLYEALKGAMERRGKHNARANGEKHPRNNVPRSRSICPAQHARCAVCGGLMYRYNEFELKCENAFRRNGTPPTCWNHVQLDCRIARKRLVQWLISQFDGQPGLRDVMIDAAWAEYQRERLRRQRSGDSVEDRISNLEKQAENLRKAIKLGGDLEGLVADLKGINVMLEGLRLDREQQQEAAGEASRYQSRDDIADRIDEALLQLAGVSYEFADLMRLIFPRFEIVPIQAIDSGLVRPRARLTLRVDRILSGDERCGEDGGGIEFELDFFDPPKHFRHLQKCLEHKRSQPQWTYEQLAAALSTPTESVSHMTVKRIMDGG